MIRWEFFSDTEGIENMVLGEYLDLSGRKGQKDGEYCIKNHVIYFSNIIWVIN
jgi:hypothetical protein